MLNALIAVLSETFSRVKAEIKQKTLYLRAMVIREQETSVKYVM